MSIGVERSADEGGDVESAIERKTYGFRKMIRLKASSFDGPYFRAEMTTTVGNNFQ